MYNTPYDKQFKALSPEVQAELKTQYPRKETTQKRNIYASSLTSLNEQAAEFAKEWGKSVEDVGLDCYIEHGYYDSTSACLDLTVEGMETDEQWHTRLGEIYRHTQWAEERDRQEYERLSKKFAKQ